MDAVNPGSAELFKGCVGSPANRNVGSFDHADPRIQQSLAQTADVGRRVHPQESGFVKPLAAAPVVHGDDAEVHLDAIFSREQPGQLSDGQPMAHRHGKVPREAAE